MSIILNNLSFTFEGHDAPLFDDLDLALSHARTGIVGRNGSGKSTLLKLIEGTLTPTRGSAATAGRVARLRQDLLQVRGRTVAQVLGIDRVLAALRRIENGSVDQHDFDDVGDDWDAEARAQAVIARRVPSLALEGVLDRSTETLSGGELVQLAMAALELDGASAALLDEPTNNLDARSRAALREAVREWPGQVVVVSHDVALLNEMDAIVELHAGRATLYGGGYDLYLEQRASAHEAALREVRDARGALRTERRDLQQVQAATSQQARQDRRRFAAQPRTPRTSDPTAKRAAEARRANRVKAAAAKVREARDNLTAADERVRDDDHIRIPVIDPGGARGRRLLDLVGEGRTLTLCGGDRWALVGDNGVGKSTLIRRSVGAASTRRVGLLDQRLELPDGTVFEAVAGAAPSRLPHDTHELLARFLVRGDMVHRDVATLSGGERFRVALARVLLASPPPELIVLDEPTNNLDLDSVDQLVEALTAYRGALLVVSHDAELLERLGLERVVELMPDGDLV